MCSYPRARALTPVNRCRAICLLLICSFAVLPVAAQESVAVRVEEDWKLVLAKPDSNSTAPQITTVFSPDLNLSGIHALFELNHRNHPVFAPGGLQLQIWTGDWPVSSASHPSTNTMSYSNEHVCWTQAMTLQDGVLTVEIVNGSSNTWGAFGGQGHLRQSVPTQLTHLNAYNPATSVKYTEIGYAANRVKSLELLRARVVLADGQTLEDGQLRVVWPKN